MNRILKQFAIAGMLCVLTQSAKAQLDSIVNHSDYRNQLYDPAPTNAPGTSLAQPLSAAIYSGSIGGTNNASTPTDGSSYLLQSIIGQSVGGVPFAFYLPGVNS